MEGSEGRRKIRDVGTDYVIGGMDRSFKLKLYQLFARWTMPGSCRV